MSGEKTHMRSDHVDEALLVKYLLGQLSEEQQAQVEDRAFADADYLSALEAAEADLIDEYVRGELPAEDRGRFERQFLPSATRRSKVEFARELARASSELQLERIAVSKPASRWEGLARVFRGWNPGLQFASGFAALFLIAGSSWLVYQNAAMRSRVTALEAQRHQLEVRQEELARQLAAQPEKEKAPGAAAPIPVIASLIFPPGLARTETSRQEFVLDPQAQIARIEIQVEPRDDYPRYRVSLRTRSGEQVFIRSNLRRRGSGGAYSVTVDVPASALESGDYEMALEGMAGGAPTELAYYYFKVKK